MTATIPTSPPTVTLRQLANGLSVRGYDVAVNRVGAKIQGIQIETRQGYRWLIVTDGELWCIGRDGAGADDAGPVAVAELSADLPMLVEWADQVMGGDR